MKKAKRLLALNFALLMLIAIAPVNAFAAISSGGDCYDVHFNQPPVEVLIKVPVSGTYEFALYCIEPGVPIADSIKVLDDDNVELYYTQSSLSSPSNWIINSYYLEQDVEYRVVASISQAASSAKLMLWPNAGEPIPLFQTYATSQNNGYGTVRVYPSRAMPGMGVQLFATPGAGFALSHWELGSQSENATITNDHEVMFTMPNGDVHVEAYFSQVFVQNTPNRGTSRVSSWVVDGRVELEASALPWYAFTGWEVLSSHPGLQAIINTNTTNSPTNPNVQLSHFDIPLPHSEVIRIWANFSPVSHAITVNRNPTVGGNASANLTSAAMNTTVTLTATPNTGYNFVRWEDTTPASALGSSPRVTITNATSRTNATFTMPNRPVTINAVFGTGSAITVTTNDSSRGTASANVASAQQGTTVTLTATPNTGFRFTRGEIVSGNITFSDVNSSTATFTMPNAAVQVRAVFEPGNAVTTSVNDAARGTASASPSAGTQGATVTLTATPNTGFKFTRWEIVSGNITLSGANSPSATFTMPNTAVSVRAVFDTANTVNATANNNVLGTATTNLLTPTLGATVTLTAAPNTGSRFLRWEVVSGGVTLSNPNARTTTFTMPNNSVQVRAVFSFDVNLDSASPWSRDELTRAISLGIVPQDLQTLFREDLTRVEFAALAVTLYETIMGREIVGRSRFVDTNDVNVEKAAAIGIVNGVGNNRYAPDRAIFRQEAAVMLARLANAVGRPLPLYYATFADYENIPEWAIRAVGQVQGSGVMTGVGSNIFAPRSLYTNEQSIATMLRLYDILT